MSNDELKVPTNSGGAIRLSNGVGDSKRCCATSSDETAPPIVGALRAVTLLGQSKMHPRHGEVGQDRAEQPRADHRGGRTQPLELEVGPLQDPTVQTPRLLTPLGRNLHRGLTSVENGPRISVRQPTKCSLRVQLWTFFVVRGTL